MALPEVKAPECHGQEHDEQWNQDGIIDQKAQTCSGQDRKQCREPQTTEGREQRASDTDLVEMTLPNRLAAFVRVHDMSPGMVRDLICRGSTMLRRRVADVRARRLLATPPDRRRRLDPSKRAVTSP